MDRHIKYKGYEIYARPQELQEGGWNTNIEIVRDAEGQRHIKPYLASNKFPTEEEAIASCLEYGRRIIDGEVPEIPQSKLP